MASSHLQDIVAEGRVTVRGQEAVTMYYHLPSAGPWRVYKSQDHENLDALAERYLDAHSTYPGPAGTTLHIKLPIACFEARIDDVYYKGVIYGNGAVVITSNGDVELYIADSDALSYKYPTTGYSLYGVDY